MPCWGWERDFTMVVSAKRSASVAVFVGVIAAICALLLALPGQTVTTKYLNDLFIFLDGVHRVTEGQVPNRDFHTALGPLVYYAPALGYWISGHLGAAMPAGMALLVLALAPASAHIVSSRLRPAGALPLVTFLFLIAAVPINLGESIGSLSFAMFYNRVGWATLGFLLIMYLRPEHPRAHQLWLDALCSACLVSLMLYTKISYGLVGLGFLSFMLLDRFQRGWAAISLVLILVTGLIIEVFWGGTVTHITDLMLAGRVSGAGGSIDQWTSVLFRNLADYSIFGIFMVLVLWRTRSIRDFLFFAFCGGSGFVLITQNFQNWGIITLAAGAAVATEMLARADASAAVMRHRSWATGAQLLLLGFVLPGIVHNSAALGLHAALAATEQGQAVPLSRFDRIRLVRLWSEGEYPTFARYLRSLEDGARALASLDQKPDHVLVLDFVSPFSAGLSLKPPHGDSTWYHWGRTVNEENYLPAAAVLHDVQVVMEPKWPIETSTAEGLRRLYGVYVADKYELAGETADWKIYVLRQSPSETVSQSPASDWHDGHGKAPLRGG